MWTPDPETIITAEQKAADAAAQARLEQFANLEPDQFWAALRFFGRRDQRDYEGELRAWVAALEPAAPEGEQTQAYLDALAFWSTVSAKVDRAKYFERDHPMIEGARQALGITEQQLDDMWMWALA